MKYKEIRKLLSEKDYSYFMEHLCAELQTFDQYETIDEMVEGEGTDNMAWWLCTDFPNFYQF